MVKTEIFLLRAHNYERRYIIVMATIVELSKDIFRIFSL